MSKNLCQGFSVHLSTDCQKDTLGRSISVGSVKTVKLVQNIYFYSSEIQYSKRQG